MKTWLSAAEIAALQLPELPETKQGVNAYATRAGWNTRPELARARADRGGGMEYHFRLLPAAARAAYVARHVEMVELPAACAREAEQEPQALNLSGTATDARDARLALLALAGRYADDAGLSRKAADAHFADLFNTGQLAVASWIRAEVKSLHPRTLKRWRKIRQETGASRLAVDRSRARRGTGILDRANAGEVKTYILALLAKQPQLTAHHIRALVADRFGVLKLSHPSRTALDDGCEKTVPIPPVRTFQHALKAWRHEFRNALEAIRNPDGFKSAIRFSARVANPASRVNEVWQIDASPADVLCVDGRHSLYVALDVHSRRMIGLVSKTPRASAVGLLVRKCILAWGVPERIKTDNGSDFIARETQRLFAALAIEHDPARVFSPEQKGHVERAIGTLQRGLMRTLEGFIGHSVADRKVIEGRKAFSARLGDAPEDTFQVALTSADLQARIDAWCGTVYANAPHAGLKGQTPFAVAAMSAGPVRRIEDERALDVLLMPVAGKDGVRTVTKSGIRVNDTHYLAGFLEVGEQVLVRMDPQDMGRAYVFDISGMKFLGAAHAPELAGIDPAQAIAAAKAEQKRLIDARIADARKEARKIKAADMAPAIARQAAREAGVLAEFPRRAETHETPALIAARQVADRHEGEPSHSAEIVALAARLQAEAAAPAANVTILRAEETPHQRWQRARALEAALDRGEPLPGDELLWLGGYREGPEYRGFALTYGDLTTEKRSPAEAGREVFTR